VTSLTCLQRYGHLQKDLFLSKTRFSFVIPTILRMFHTFFVFFFFSKSINLFLVTAHCTTITFITQEVVGTRLPVTREQNQTIKWYPIALIESGTRNWNISNRRIKVVYIDDLQLLGLITVGKSC